MPLADVRVVGVDADETLWPTAMLYDDAIAQFMAVLQPWTDNTALSRFVTQHQAAAPIYGYGALPLLRSMVAFAASHAADAPGELYQEAVRLVERIHLDDAAPFPGTATALTTLRETGLRIVLITMGSNAEQVAKIDRSGLKRLVDGVVVVASKDAPTYRGILDGLGVEPEQFVMVGDSTAFDISPPLSLGCNAVLIATEGGDPAPEGVPAVERFAVAVDLIVAAVNDAAPTEPDADPEPARDSEPSDTPEATEEHPALSDPAAEPEPARDSEPSDTPEATEEHPALSDPAAEPEPARDSEPSDTPEATEEHPALSDPAAPPPPPNTTEPPVARPADPATADSSQAADGAAQHDAAEATEEHPALSDPARTLEGRWVLDRNGKYRVALPPGAPPVGEICEVAVEPVPGRRSIWPVQVTEARPDGGLGLIAEDGSTGVALPAGRWVLVDGGGFGVQVQGELPADGVELVVVAGATATAALRVRATGAVEDNRSICLPVDAEGKAAPMPGRRRAAADRGGA